MKEIGMIIVLLRLNLESYLWSGRSYEVRIISQGSRIFRKERLVRILRVNGGVYRIGEKLYDRKGLVKRLVDEVEDLENEVLWLDTVMRYGVLYHKVGGWRRFIIIRGFKIIGWMRYITSSRDKVNELDGVDYEVIEKGWNNYDFGEVVEDELYKMLKYESVRLKFCMILIMFWFNFFGIKYMWLIRRWSGKGMRGLIRRMMGEYKLGLKLGLESSTKVRMIGLSWYATCIGEYIIVTDGIEEYVLSKKEAEENGVVDGVILDRYKFTKYLEVLSQRFMRIRRKEEIEMLVSEMELYGMGLKSKVKKDKQRDEFKRKYCIRFKGEISYLDRIECKRYTEYFIRYYGRYVVLTEGLLNSVVRELVRYYGDKFCLSEYWRIGLMSKIDFTSSRGMSRKEDVLRYVIKVLLGIARCIGWIGYNVEVVRTNIRWVRVNLTWNYVYIKKKIKRKLEESSVESVVEDVVYMIDCFFRWVESFCFRIVCMTWEQVRLMYNKCRMEWLKRKLRKLRGKGESDITEKYGGSVRGRYEERKGEEEVDEEIKEDLEVNNTIELELEEEETLEGYRRSGEYNEGLDMDRSKSRHFIRMRRFLRKNKERKRYIGKKYLYKKTGVRMTRNTKNKKV